MKKILFVIVIIVESFVSFSMGQLKGLYLYTGDTYLSTGLKFCDNDGLTVGGEDYTYIKGKDTYYSFGIGFLSDGGYGVEFGIIEEVTSIDLYSRHSNVNSGWRIGVFHRASICDDINWSVNLSYRRLSISNLNTINKFHDILIEPLVLEYTTKDNHWGFKMSLISIEAMTLEGDSDDKTKISYHNSAGTSAIGLSFNTFPVNVCFYF